MFPSKYLALLCILFLVGCDIPPGEDFDDERVCCEALTAECLACFEGVSVEEYCQKNPGRHDCTYHIVDCLDLPEEEHTSCCQNKIGGEEAWLNPETGNCELIPAPSPPNTV